MKSISGKKSRLIFLTGFMGSGKSTVGPILANTLGFQYADLDRLIEEQQKMSITKIFNSLGEKEFRNIEHKLIKKIVKYEDYVISLGGGTFANEENYSMISKNGLVVYLALSPEEVIKRMHNKVDRPLLRNADGRLLKKDELEVKVKKLLQDRSFFYERADLIISTENRNIGLTIDEIINWMRKQHPKRMSI
jgi:shikimate kinase